MPTSAKQRALPSVGIVTFHHVYNYGAFLQAWSLVQTLERMGCAVDVIDYQPLGLDVKAKTRGIKALIPPLGLWRFRRFVKSNLPLTPTFRTIEQIAKWVDTKRYDFLVCGSDQIWLKDDYVGFDRAYYLDFGDSSVTRRVAYGPSCAYMRDYGEHADEARRLLSRFHAVSARDENTLRLLTALGIANVSHVVDPTFLADFDAFMKPPGMKGNYLLVVGRMDRSACDVIRGLGERLKTPVVALARCPVADVRKRFITPDEWVGYIAHARYVVTSLFHGTALAVKFRRPFISFGSGRSRRLKILDLLQRFDLQSRFLEPAQDSWGLLSELLDLDYTHADRLISEAVDSSLKYLRAALNG